MHAKVQTYSKELTVVLTQLVYMSLMITWLWSFNWSSVSEAQEHHVRFNSHTAAWFQQQLRTASSFTRHMWFICISPLHEPSPSIIKLKPNFSFHSPLLHNSITRSYSKSHKRCCLHTPTHGQKGRSVLQLWGWSICNNSDGTGCSISQCRLLHVTAPSVVVATLNLLFFPT